MKNILIKIHKSSRWVVAICDKDLLGKKFTEENKQLDLTGEFFNGEEIDEKMLKEEIHRCATEDATFNIIGENSTRIAKEVNLIKEEGIMKIDGIPFALSLL